MFKALRRRFTLMYTITTGIILTIVLGAAIITSEQQLKAKNEENFKSILNNISSKLRTENIISNTWLAEMEVENSLIIHIEDNKNPLVYQGAWMDRDLRAELVEKVKSLAADSGLDTNVRPISSGEITSEVFNLKGEDGGTYLGAVAIIPVNRGFRSLVLIRYLPAGSVVALRQRLIYSLFYILGIFAFWFVSWRFAGKSLEPVEKNRRRQTEFVAAASHELRSPLAVIRASSSALRVDPDKLLHFTDGIEKECQRMSRLIDDMLLLASTDADNWSIKKEEVNLDTLLIEAYELYLPLCKEKGLVLELDLPEMTFSTYYGDSQRLAQTISILLDNAISYCGNKSPIVLRAYEKKHHYYIEVEDHGVGIPDEKKEFIFERFYRADASRKDKTHFGLGLSIASELIRLHNGSLSVMDTPGGGATFVIKLAK